MKSDAVLAIDGAGGGAGGCDALEDSVENVDDIADDDGGGADEEIVDEGDGGGEGECGGRGTDVDSR